MGRTQVTLLNDISCYLASSKPFLWQYYCLYHCEFCQGVSLNFNFILQPTDLMSQASIYQTGTVTASTFGGGPFTR